MPPRSIDRAVIEAELDQIRSLGLDALRKRWSTMFGAAPPAGLTKDVIARMIAYRIQEESFGGDAREVVRLLDGLARGEKVGAEFNRRLKAGTVLVREYRGERHSVTIVPDGYVWRGTTYASLSIIARTITGTTWSGPRFFGVRNTHGIEANAQPGYGKTTSAGSSTNCLPSKTNNKSARRVASL
jgi:Protein of unknown function (DUF2924)